MASVRTFTLPHYEAYPVHVALFRDVTNTAFLRSQLLEANPEFDYAFLDASMVCTIFFTFALPYIFHHLKQQLHIIPAFCKLSKMEFSDISIVI
jgi:EKC/KEOPS complex subunit CGI121/TPRKB